MGNELTKTPTTPEETDRRNNLIGIIVGVCVGILLFGLICLWLAYKEKKREKNLTNSQRRIARNLGFDVEV